MGIQPLIYDFLLCLLSFACDTLYYFGSLLFVFHLLHLCVRSENGEIDK